MASTTPLADLVPVAATHSPITRELDVAAIVWVIAVVALMVTVTCPMLGF
ncbi:MAG: hypothetical protein ACYCYD_02135 [Acidimicrobiales bacterium]